MGVQIADVASAAFGEHHVGDVLESPTFDGPRPYTIVGAVFDTEGREGQNATITFELESADG